jgi:hypothetical protein
MGIVGMPIFKVMGEPMRVILIACSVFTLFFQANFAFAFVPLTCSIKGQANGQTITVDGLGTLSIDEKVSEVTITLNGTGTSSFYLEGHYAFSDSKFKIQDGTQATLGFQEIEILGSAAETGWQSGYNSWSIFPLNADGTTSANEYWCTLPWAQ